LVGIVIICHRHQNKKGLIKRGENKNYINHPTSNGKPTEGNIKGRESAGAEIELQKTKRMVEKKKRSPPQEEKHGRESKPLFREFFPESKTASEVIDDEKQMRDKEYDCSNVCAGKKKTLRKFVLIRGKSEVERNGRTPLMTH